MQCVKSILLASCIFLLFFSVFSIRPVLGYTEKEARETIEAAEEEVLNCYDAVLEAERSGANVCELLVILNDADWLLSRAKTAYDRKDFNSTFANATMCRSKLDGFVNQAYSLRLEAERAAYYDFMVNFVGSSVGGLCVVLGGFMVWKFLKKREEAKEGV